MEHLSRDKAKAAAIRANLHPIRARLDQLTEEAEEQGVRISRMTIEALMDELAVLREFEKDARALKNQRLIGEVTKERDRARQGLGLLPRSRRHA